TVGAAGSGNENEPLLKEILSEVKAAVDAGTTSRENEPLLQQILVEVKLINAGMEVLIQRLTKK
ncbi:hypothetical protein A2U01_0058093, partial [Trifolium medium]|nr:hypothetical protein [Trifolium medium]